MERGSAVCKGSQIENRSRSNRGGTHNILFCIAVEKVLHINKSILYLFVFKLNAPLQSSDMFWVRCSTQEDQQGLGDLCVEATTTD